MVLFPIPFYSLYLLSKYVVGTWRREMTNSPKTKMQKTFTRQLLSKSFPLALIMDILFTTQLPLSCIAHREK